MKSNVATKIGAFMITGLIVILMQLWGCATLQQLANIQEPQLDVQNVRFTGMSFETLDLAFDIKIKNPNALAVNLAGFDYDFQINDASFLKGQQNQPISVQAMGESAVEIPLTLTFKDLYSTFQSLKNQDSSAYKLVGGLSFNLPVLGATRIPISKSGKLPNLKLPEVKIGALKLNKLSFSGADLELKLDVVNPNTFNFLLSKLNYDFAVNGKTWVKGLTQNAMQVKEKGESTIAIPISLNFLEMGSAIYQMISGNQKLNYKLQGNLDLNSSLPLLGTVSLPLDRTGELNISK
ncbi:MAG: LEA type 2 family protein [candidate division KSB1 bacterium]|nr:LEA type 2 family protein [candidate division KSB1 bacterium]MDZ7340940.1 LEA type 2 family protein [candidate division KSB1 bacterium]